MLSELTKTQIRGVKGSLPKIIDDSFVIYEREVEKLSVSVEKEAFKKAMLDFTGVILDRIQSEKPLTTVPLYATISYTLIQLQFDIEKFLVLYTIINKVIAEFLIITFNRRDTALGRYITRYYTEIQTSLDGLNIFLKGLQTEQIVQLIPEYAPSLAVVRDIVSNKQISNNTLYTLFGEDNYWEVQSRKYRADPTFSTRNYTILDGTLYVINKNINRPNTEFDIEEWSKYKSKFLDRDKTFKSRLKRSVSKYVVNALEQSGDINEIISDSKVAEETTGLVYDEKDLSLTFGGVGKNIIENILSLKTILKYFGNKESSPVGDIDYVASFCEYLYAGCYGRSLPTGFFENSGLNIFGSFNLIFYYPQEVNKIAGLKFIEGFKDLKSFKQNLELEESVVGTPPINPSEKKEIIYNPIYAKYNKGLKDRFLFDIRNPYTDNYEYSVDVILFGLESITNIANILGDTLEALSESLGPSGVLPGYEGLGSIALQIEELSKVFISKPTLDALTANGEKVLPGLNGLTTYLLNSYRKLTGVVPDVPFTGKSLAQLSTWGRNVQKYIERMLADTKNVGYLPGTFIPNISFKNSTVEKNVLIDQLRSLNFQESEINKFISAESFEDLLLEFAPLSDSRDQISFFRGYELSQLIYEFGGESAIDAYLNYLYSQDSQGLVNLLNISLKNQSNATIYNTNRYGKLVGLLMGLTFAIDPEQLEIFKNYLSGNKLTFFESISFLLKNKEKNILLNKEEVSLLNPVSKSLIFGKSPFELDSYSIDYQTTNENAPIALKQYTEILDKNLGEASTNFVQNLYDKSQGLTVKELLRVINPQGFHTDLGQLIDGYEGGRLTRVINYAYFSGILHKVGYYNNSYQAPNFFVQPGGHNLTVLVEIINSLILSLDITLTNFVNTLEDDFSQEVLELYPFSNISNSYNKKLDSLSKLVKNLVPIDGDISNLGAPEIAGDEAIIGSPGIGNSPMPESIIRENSISPEQANILSPQIKTNYSFLAPKKTGDLTESEVINTYTKFIENTKSIVGISRINSISITESDLSSKDSESKLTDINKKDLESFDPFLLTTNSFRDSVEDVVVSNLLKNGLISEFDAIASCKRFGGTNCEQRIEKAINTCGDPSNKAIYSERDETTFIPSSNGGILVDRPYGKNSEVKLSVTFIPTGPNNRPEFFNVFNEDNIKIGINGDPILPSLSSDPLVFTKQDSDPKEKFYSQYYNSEFGLIEAIKARWEKDEPFKCSLLEDPYAYQACMNLLKCKRFNRVDEIDFLKFCPKTLAGGLFK